MSLWDRSLLGLLRAGRWASLVGIAACAAAHVAPSTPSADRKRSETFGPDRSAPPVATNAAQADVPVQDPPAEMLAAATSARLRRASVDAPAPAVVGEFPPPAVPPPHLRTAKPGDGVWTPLPNGERDGVPVMARTRLHVHHIRPDKSLEVVAIDRRAVEPVLVVGKSDPTATSIGTPRTGLVPAEELPGALAVFNGGFMQRHGAWGLVVGGDEYTPPKHEGCSIVSYRDGSFRIASHHKLGARSDIAWLRQTPPCLVEDGVAGERVLRDPSSVIWGKAIGGKFDIRRSALGLDATGRVLYYVFSDWNDPAELARGLVALGVSAAAELDVNWSYTWFYWLGQGEGGLPRIAEALVPKAKYHPLAFIERPAARDFFYLRARP